jgi:hypothetical protein
MSLKPWHLTNDDRLHHHDNEFMALCVDLAREDNEVGVGRSGKKTRIENPPEAGFRLLVVRLRAEEEKSKLIQFTYVHKWRKFTSLSPALSLPHRPSAVNPSQQLR